jgi:hypothetical protein
VAVGKAQRKPIDQFFAVPCALVIREGLSFDARIYVIMRVVPREFVFQSRGEWDGGNH